jgi:hypothetical protein
MRAADHPRDYAFSTLPQLTGKTLLTGVDTTVAGMGTRTSNPHREMLPAAGDWASVVGAFT